MAAYYLWKLFGSFSSESISIVVSVDAGTGTTLFFSSKFRNGLIEEFKLSDEQGTQFPINNIKVGFYLC
jgi:hypothetical protein